MDTVKIPVQHMEHDDASHDMIRLVAGSEERAPVRGGALHDPPPAVDIAVPIHNAWHVVRPCLESVQAFTDYPEARVLLLDDGSDGFVRERLAAARDRGGPLPVRLVRHEAARGFVQSANRAFRETDGDYVALLNSDTLVTPGWLARLVAAAESDERIGCVMPMSNHCSFHSLAVPMGWNVFQYAADLGRRMRCTAFDAVTASAFCLLFRRAALEDVGPFDEAFGLGYGEESDWSMRARHRGWKVAGAEDAFVYHRGRVSFKDHKERTFREHNYRLFMERWGAGYSAAMARYAREDALGPLRRAYVRMSEPVAPPVLPALMEKLRTGGPLYAATEAGRYIRDKGGLAQLRPIVRSRGLLRRSAAPHPTPRGFASRTRPRVVYVLEKFSVSGGVLSVVQLANRLTLLGWDAKIATHHDHEQDLIDAYMLYHTPYVFPTSADMVRSFPEADVIVATLWSTAAKVHEVVGRRHRRAVPWYFLQDDETRFFSAWDHAGRRAVTASYELIPHKIVKSAWLAGLLSERGHATHRVPIGMDLDMFYEEDPARERPPRVLGMARPKTPRRGFAALVATMREIKRRRPEVEVCLFGCEHLAGLGLDFEHTDLGLVPHERLRRIYNDARVLVDTSAFQGLGRLGLEAMACGCAAVLTRFGGIDEYARHGTNCLSVDPSDGAQTVAAVLRLLDDDALRRRLVAAGLETVRNFSCDAEARETSRLFARSLGIACAPDGSVATPPSGAPAPARTARTAVETATGLP